MRFFLVFIIFKLVFEVHSKSESVGLFEIEWKFTDAQRHSLFLSLFVIIHFKFLCENVCSSLLATCFRDFFKFSFSFLINLFLSALNLINAWDQRNLTKNLHGPQSLETDIIKKKCNALSFRFKKYCPLVNYLLSMKSSFLSTIC